jgi:hypothetical protein
MIDVRTGAEVAWFSQNGVNLDLGARRPARWSDDFRRRVETLVLELVRCEWIEKRQNCIALGPSGSSKAHIGIALGLVASGFNSLIVCDLNG